MTATGVLHVSTTNGEVLLGDGGNNAYIDATTGHPVELRSNGNSMLHLDPDNDHVLEVGARHFVLSRPGFQASLGVASNGNLQLRPADGQVVSYTNDNTPSEAGSDNTVLSRLMGDNRYSPAAATLRTRAAFSALMDALGVSQQVRVVINDILEADA
jgi:hypothetical protein